MTAPILKQPSSGGLSTFRAAEYSVQVNTTPDEATPTWVWWYGISKFDPTADPTMQDDTDIGSGGFKSQQVTATSLDISVEGLFKGLRGEDGVVPLDPGTAYVRSKRFKVGVENEVHLRYWRNDGVPDYIEHHFTAAWKDVGGGIEDLQKYTVDMKGRGEPTVLETKPVDIDGDGVADDIVTTTFTLDGDTTAGSWTITVDGETLTGIAFDEATADLQTDIRTLSTVSDTATVTGVAGDNYIVTWLTPAPVSISASGAGLTPPSTVAIEHTYS